MLPKSPQWVDDIADASGFIMEATADVNATDFASDRRLRDAVALNIANIGRALRRLEQTDPATAARFPGSRRASELGERLARVDEDMSDNELWRFVLDNVPRLHLEATVMLQAAEREAAARASRATTRIDEHDGAPPAGNGSRRASCLDNPVIAEHLEAIRALCREYGVLRLEVFGSACTPEFDPGRSDVDFLVEYPDDYDYGPWASRVQDLQEALASLLGREVDLVMTRAIRKKYFLQSVNETRELLYAA